MSVGITGLEQMDSSGMPASYDFKMTDELITLIITMIITSRKYKRH